MKLNDIEFRENLNFGKTDYIRYADEYAILPIWHQNLLIDALAEIKATIDGNSDQSVHDIIYGLLDEIKEKSKKNV